MYPVAPKVKVTTDMQGKQNVQKVEHVNEKIKEKEKKTEQGVKGDDYLQW